MKVIGFHELGKKKKSKRINIFCIGKVFKPLFFGMLGVLVLLVTNLLVNNFFVNISASVEHFVKNFISFFRFVWKILKLKYIGHLFCLGYLW